MRRQCSSTANSMAMVSCTVSFYEKRKAYPGPPLDASLIAIQLLFSKSLRYTTIVTV